MKLSCALLLLTSAFLGVRPSSAQGDPKYLEVGTTLTLEPDVSTVKKPIDSIRWKYGKNLVVDWDPSGHTYYGSFKGRTTLDQLTLWLVIKRLTLADGGQFSLETNLGTVGTHEVKVIKSPPKPSIKTQPLVCDGTCALKCTADLQDLGPVTYEWKKDEGEWTKGDELKGMNESKTPEEFSCRLKTQVRPSDASDRFLNPLKPPKPPGPPQASGAIAAIVITVLLFAVVAALIAVVLKCPELWFSIWVKNFIPGNKPADGASGAGNKPADGASGASNKKKEDHDKEDPLMTPTPGPVDSESG